jgi:hypothetical protein
VLGHRPAQEIHVQPFDVPGQVSDADVLLPAHFDGDVRVTQCQIQID